MFEWMRGEKREEEREEERIQSRRDLSTLPPRKEGANARSNLQS